MNLKMRKYNYSFVSRTYWHIYLRIRGCENARITTSTHEPKNTRMWRCRYTSKRTWTWGHEDVRMRGYKQAHMNLRIRVCEDAGIQESAHEPEDMRMWGCKVTSKHTWTWGYDYVRMQGYKQAHMNLRTWVCKDARIQATTHEHKDVRMRGWKDTSKCTGT